MSLLGGTLVVLAIVLLAGLLWQSRRELSQLRARARRIRDEQARLERAHLTADERERIYRDLHDDIGAKLLDLALTAETPRQADLARSVLQDLRDVVSRSRGEPGTLQDTLADIHEECRQRLEALDVALEWQADDDLPDPELDHGEALHLHRIVREAMTNALRHARPARIRVRAMRGQGELLLDITDEGGFAASASGTGGRGTEGMQARAEELQGSIRWTPGTMGGTKVILRMPLPLP